MIDKIAFGGRIKTSELPHFEITSLILKCCKSLLPEHQAQVINYLKLLTFLPTLTVEL